ncbi:MAG: hypothetical protein JNM56_09720 [Planctomycetia bacterium]|nr:hypothetical protein [Planctomycetia bacterium]
MQRQCPRCKSPLGDDSQCAECGYTPGAKAPRRGGPRAGAGPMKWQQTAWGKIVVGLLLAIGIYYGLLQLASAVLLAAYDPPARQAWLSSFNGLILKQMLQAGALLVGGMMAGAGQKRGILYGSIVGVYNAVIFLVVEAVILNQVLTKDLLLALLVLVGLQIAFGTLGGYLGQLIWKPIQTVAVASPHDAPAAADRFALPPKPPKPSQFAGSVNWVRVIPGSAIAIAGTLFANTLFKMLESAAAAEPADTARQAQFLTWEISVLAMLVGGGMAGSNSNNGMKQGLAVGILACLVLIGVFIVRGDNTSTGAPLWIFKVLGLEQVVLLQRIIYTVLSVIPLSLAGGWFGSQLMPPIVLPKGKRLLSSGIS